MTLSPVISVPTAPSLPTFLSRDIIPMYSTTIIKRNEDLVRERINWYLREIESILRFPWQEILKAKLLNPFEIALTEFDKLSFVEFKVLLEKAHELCKAKVEKMFNENPMLQELVLCEGEIVLTSKEEGGISNEAVRRLMEERKKPCYLIARPDKVEEAPWIKIDDDYYPALQLFLGSESWIDEEVERKGKRIVADFDTGNAELTIFNEEIGHDVVVQPALYEFRRGSHLNAPYFYFIRRAKICIKDRRGKVKSQILKCRFVRDWDESPLVVANPNRKGFIGRHFMFIFGLKVLLDALSKTSIVEFTS